MVYFWKIVFFSPHIRFFFVFFFNIDNTVIKWKSMQLFLKDKKKIHGI